MDVEKQNALVKGDSQRVAAYEGQSSSGVGAAGGPDAKHLRRDVQHYIDLLLRRWWLILASCLVTVGMTWWKQKDRIPVYTAEALLEQRAGAAVAPLLGPALGRSGDFGAQVEIIRSRSVIGPVVESLGLQLRLPERRAEWMDLVEKLEAEPNPPGRVYILTEERGTLVLSRARDGETIATAQPGEPIEGPGFRLWLADPGVARVPIQFSVRRAQGTVESFQGRLKVEMGKGPGLLRLGFTDPDPRRAAAVVNAVAESYQRYRGRVARDGISIDSDNHQ